VARVFRQFRGGEDEGRSLEKAAQIRARGGELVRLGQEIGVLRGEPGTQPLALHGIGRKPGVVPVGQARPALGGHARLESSRHNQARAVFQSLMTVRADTPSVSAVSSTVNPPKNLSSTT
jgi:hypothetical protein